MLKFLRKKDSIIVKIILGSLVLVFIIAFGWDAARNVGNTRPNTPAEVNGVPINPQKLAFLIDERLEEMRPEMSGETPANITEFIRQNVISTLIHTEILNQQAQTMGLGTSDAELAAFIRQFGPALNQGRFDRDFYLNKFAPWYQNTRGVSFETDMRRELTLKKILDEFQNLIVPDRSTLEQSYRIENTQYKFSIVKVRVTPQNIDDVLPKDLENTQTSEETGKQTQKEIAEKIYAAWKSGKDISGLLADQKLKIRETQELDATELATVFDGKDDIASLSQLLALTPEKPFPNDFFNQGSYYYLVKLTEYKKAQEPSDEDLEKIKAAYVNDLANALQTAWISDAKSKTKIVYSE